MPLPSFRNSRSKVRRRRSHLALSKIDSTNCAKCGEPVLPHRACKACGFYKDKQYGKKAEAVEVKPVKKAAVGRPEEASKPTKEPRKAKEETKTETKTEAK